MEISCVLYHHWYVKVSVFSSSGEDAVIVFSLLTHISSSPSNNREGVFGIITCSVSLFSQNSAPSSSKLSEARAVRV